MVSYRDRGTELIEAGEPFGAVENVIDERAGLTEEAKAALWLFAFSMCDQEEQLRRARAHPGAPA